MKKLDYIDKSDDIHATILAEEKYPKNRP